MPSFHHETFCIFEVRKRVSPGSRPFGYKYVQLGLDWNEWEQKIIESTKEWVEIIENARVIFYYQTSNILLSVTVTTVYSGMAGTQRSIPSTDRTSATRLRHLCRSYINGSTRKLCTAVALALLSCSCRIQLPATQLRDKLSWTPETFSRFIV